MLKYSRDMPLAFTCVGRGVLPPPFVPVRSDRKGRPAETYLKPVSFQFYDTRGRTSNFIPPWGRNVMRARG